MISYLSDMMSLTSVIYDLKRLSSFSISVAFLCTLVNAWKVHSKKYAYVPIIIIIICKKEFFSRCYKATRIICKKYA